MDPEYVRRYRDLYQRHWWWRAREEVIIDLLRQRKPPHGWHHILDIGCGGGVFFDRLAEFGDTQGIEPDAALVGDDRAVRQRIHVGPFDASYQPTHAFGLILMLDVIEHLDHPVGALRHALALLEPEGLIFLTVPAFLTLWTSHDVFNHHRTRYTKTTMRALAVAAGLRIERMDYFFHWTFPVKFAQRIVEGVVSSEPKPAAVPRHSINAALYRLSRAEYRALRALHLPFGSSLLVLGGRSR